MDDIIKQACRDLRKTMTPAEELFWNHVRKNKNNLKFYRQKAIFVYKEEAGLDRWIIADFYIPEYKLVVEMDGGIHKQKDIYGLDRIKEKLLGNRGYNVIRFTNEEVIHNIKEVLQKIDIYISTLN